MVELRKRKKTAEIIEPPPKRASRARKNAANTTKNIDASQDSSLEDYNICSQERTQLLTSLKNSFGGKKFSSTFWASCQLSDISKLRNLVDAANAYPDLVGLYDTGDLEMLPLLCKLTESKPY